MRKKDELSREHTCMQHAHPEEMVFVLLSRDAAAPAAIRAWIGERIRLGKNAPTDPQIAEAEECAKTMEAEGRKWAGDRTFLVTNRGGVYYAHCVESPFIARGDTMDALYDNIVWHITEHRARHTDPLPRVGNRSPGVHKETTLHNVLATWVIDPGLVHS
jgi:hypothetical protein